MALFSNNKTKNIEESSFETKLKMLKNKTKFAFKDVDLNSLAKSMVDEDSFFAVANILYERLPFLKNSEEDFLTVLREYTHFYKYFNYNKNVYIDTVKLLTESPGFVRLIPNIRAAFSDTNLIYETLLFLSNLYKRDNNTISVENTANLEIIITYLISARKYYVDDRALFASFIELISTLGINKLDYAEKDEITKVCNQYLDEAKKLNGIYDISHEELELMEDLASELGIKSSQLRTLLNLSTSQIEKVKTTFTTLRDDAAEYANAEMRNLETRAEEAINRFEQVYLELQNNAKKDVFEDRDSIVNEMKRNANRELASVIQELNRIKKEYTETLNELKKEYKNVTSIFESTVLKEFIDLMTSDDKLLEKLSAVSHNTSPTTSQTPVSEVSTERKEIIVPSSEVTLLKSPAKEEPIDLTPIYYFDNSTEFMKRFKSLMDKKKACEQEGEIFNECFDDILKIIIHNNVPYIYGPSGSGKTYLIEKQLSKILGLKVMNQHYINYEQEILGFNNAGNGEYVATNFFRAFRMGNIIFFDEIDVSNPKALTILHSFLTGSAHQTYTYPDGTSVIRHPNFRIICAGNTKGAGRTTEYSTRVKFDESFNQRVWPVYCDYDEKIDKRILKNYPEWLEFSLCFREAIRKIKMSSDAELNSSGIFTTRDAAEIVTCLDDGSFNAQDLIKYKFIQTKDIDDLNQIISYMNENFANKNGNKDKSLKLFDEFKNQVSTKEKRLGL